MPKWVCIVCGVLMLLTGCAKQTPPSVETMHTEESKPTDAVYTLNFTETLLHNDSVGNDWEIIYTCDGRPVADGERFAVPVDTIQNLTIDVTIIEKDKRSDIGCGALTAVLRDGRTSSVTVTVAENGGRYRNRTARWEISCECIEQVIRPTDHLRRACPSHENHP